MRKHIICLANSRKYRERCIAGIEVTPQPNGKWRMQRNENGSPKWIRPITRSEHGSVSEDLVADIELLDVITFKAIRALPKGYQSENVLFATESLRIVDKVSPHPDNLAFLAFAPQPCLLGNFQRRLPIAEIDHIRHSLEFQRIENIEVYYPVHYKTRNPRANFTVGGHRYENVSITDTKNVLRLEEAPKLLENHEHIYGCFSLSLPFQGYYYKLLAGLVYT